MRAQNQGSSLASVVLLEPMASVLGTHFCATGPLKLILTCTSQKGTYTATDPQGTMLFKVEPREGFRDKRVLLDSAGNIICTFAEKALTIHNTWTAYRGIALEESNMLFTARNGSLFQLKTGIEVTLPPKDQPSFSVNGEYLKRRYTLSAHPTGQPLACGVRRRDAAHFFACSNTYDIEIEAGVDTAFVVALMVIVDDIHADKNTS